MTGMKRARALTNRADYKKLKKAAESTVHPRLVALRQRQARPLLAAPVSEQEERQMTSTGMKRARAFTTSATADYKKLKKATEAAVVRWEWATKQRHSHVPAYFETRNQTRGRALKAEPTTWSYQVQEGYDAKGRMVVERRRTNTKDSQYETFYRFTAAGIEMYEYSYETYKPKEWDRVAWLAITDGRVTAVNWIGKGEGDYTRTFEYDDDGRVIGYEQIGTDDDGKRSPAQSFEIEHDAKGIVRTWWLTSRGKRGSKPYWERASAKAKR